jgi:hypothetical protein
MFGQAVFTRQGFTNDYQAIPVQVPDGSAASGIDIRLVHSSSISGRVRRLGNELSASRSSCFAGRTAAALEQPVPAGFGQTEGPFSMFQDRLAAAR